MIFHAKRIHYQVKVLSMTIFTKIASLESVGGPTVLLAALKQTTTYSHQAQMEKYCSGKYQILP